MVSRCFFACLILVACGPQDPWPIGGAAPAFGEFEVEDPTYSSSSASNLHVVDVGTHYFALWERSGSIVGARISYDGQLLDTGGISLVNRRSDFGDGIRSVVFDGSELVLSIDWYVVDSPLTGTSVALFDRDGHPLDAGALADHPSRGSFEAAFDGTSLVLAWVGDTDGLVRAQTVTPGTLALGSEHQISTTAGIGVNIAVHDGAAMLSWVEGATFRTSVLAADGSPLLPGGTEYTDPVGDTADPRAHTLHGTPAGFAMLHEHPEVPSGRSLVEATFFDAAGTPITEPPLSLSDPAGAASTYEGSAASFGSDWLVVVAVGGQPEGYVIDAATRTVTSGPIALADSAGMFTRLECHAAECTVAVEDTAFPPTVRLDRYTPAFERTGSLQPAISAQAQIAPVAAFDGSQYAIMWSQGFGEFRVRRLSREGRWLDATPIVIPLTGLSSEHWIEGYPDGGFLVAWADGSTSSTYYVRRMNADGSWAWPAVPTFSTLTMPWRTGQRAVCAPDACLVLGGANYESEFVAIGRDGTELARSPTLVGESVVPYFDGVDTFWLAYLDSDYWMPLHVLAVEAAGPSAGQIRRSFDVEPTSASLLPLMWHRFGDDQLLLTRRADSGVLEARTLTPDGLSAPTAIADSAPGWLVGAVSDQQLDLVFARSVFDTDDSELVVTRFDRARGVVQDAVPLFDGLSLTSSAVSMVADGNRTLLTFNRRGDIGFGTIRARAAFIGDRSWLLPNDAACVDDGECAGGRCRDLQCCDECPLWRGP